MIISSITCPPCGCPKLDESAIRALTRNYGYYLVLANKSRASIRHEKNEREKRRNTNGQ